MTALRASVQQGIASVRDLDTSRLTPTVLAYLALLTLAVAASLASSSFLERDNLLNVGRQAAPLAMVALAQTVVILIGGVDVSVGAVMSLTTVVVSNEMGGDPANIAPAIAIVLAIGLVVGLLNGLLIAKLEADPFVTTLAAMLILQGVALVYTEGSPTSGLTPGFRDISESEVLGIPTSVVIVAVAAVAVWFALRRTAWGRQIYAIGGNERAAYLSGRRVDTIKVSAYVVCSLLSVLAGVILVSRLGTGEVSAGSGFELDSIAAVLIGGTAFGGGRGGIAGTIAGVLILVVLFNLVNLLALPSVLQLIVRGVVIVVGVAAYSRRAANP
jgi:ribose transport system permease protein